MGLAASNQREAWTPELEAAARAAATNAGFHLAGIAPAEAASGDPGAALPLDAERFSAWIDAGRAGEMDYLKRRDANGTLLRNGLRVAIPWARSIIVCAMNYDSGHPLSTDRAPMDAGWIGRYAWSGKRRHDDMDGDRLAPTDYHQELLGRLHVVEAQLHEVVACETKCYVDTGPIVERGFAVKAGIGWVGKNTCVIDQQTGSWLLLGVVVTSLALDDADGIVPMLAADRCGSCTRCIDACPTGALVAPREMDASLCIAYLTIEKKGAIATEFREAMGRQVFGCDICQDVCPWNRRHRSQSPGRVLPVSPGLEPRPELVNPPLRWLAAMDSRQFKEWFKGSPLERTGRKRLQRNVAIAMGNSGDAEHLPKLHEWAGSDDAVLAEAAKWAMERIRHCVR